MLKILLAFLLPMMIYSAPMPEELSPLEMAEQLSPEEKAKLIEGIDALLEEANAFYKEKGYPNYKWLLKGQYWNGNLTDSSGKVNFNFTYHFEPYPESMYLRLTYMGEEIDHFYKYIEDENTVKWWQITSRKEHIDETCIYTKKNLKDDKSPWRAHVLLTKEKGSHETCSEDLELFR